MSEQLESMKDYDEEINRSFHKLREGDLVNCTVLTIKETEVIVDIGSYTEGIISRAELSDDPHFNLHSDIHTGDVISAIILQEENQDGYVLLSKKQADQLTAWTQLHELYKNKERITVTCSEEVNGGLIAYVKGIRGFIPASQLSLSYVENLSDWVKKELSVVIITLDEEKKKLVLSAKEVLKEEAKQEERSKLSALQKGLVTTGIVEKIMPYGAFVTLSDGLTGLVHISQICGKHIKSPNEVLKEGEEVTVKILDVKDDKISLSIKAVQPEAEITDVPSDVLTEYISDGHAATDLSALLKNLNLK